MQLLIPGLGHRVAALFVQEDGVYAAMPDVAAWPESRDARTYPGPLPVVAHPPCASWGRYSKPSPDSTARGPLRGDDGGCFLAALNAVRTWGGAIEHPAGSAAWGAYGLPGPMAPLDAHGGWTLPVYQSWWGHEAIKPTWLYLVGVERACIYPAPLTANIRPLEHMGKVQRAASPLPFARWLVELAASSRVAAPASPPPDPKE
jgi:hypothetical protein